MIENETTALALVAAELGLDTAGSIAIGWAAKKFYELASYTRLSSELKKLELEESIEANLRSLDHNEVEKYIDELSKTPRAEQITREFENTDPSKRPNGADLVKIAREIAKKAEVSIDSKKRKLLAAAVLNSFDPILYQLGMTEDLLRTLDDLTYADATLLRQFGGKSAPKFSAVQRDHTGDPSYEIVQKLIHLNLVDDWSKRDESHKRLAYTISNKGRAMLRLLAEEELA